MIEKHHLHIILTFPWHFLVWEIQQNTAAFASLIHRFFFDSLGPRASSAWGAFCRRGQWNSSQMRRQALRAKKGMILFKGLLHRRLHNSCIQFLNMCNLVRLMSATACQIASYFIMFPRSHEISITRLEPWFVCQGSFADAATGNFAIGAGWWCTSVSWPLNHERAWLVSGWLSSTIQPNLITLLVSLSQMASNG